MAEHQEPARTKLPRPYCAEEEGKAYNWLQGSECAWRRFIPCPAPPGLQLWLAPSEFYSFLLMLTTFCISQVLLSFSAGGKLSTDFASGHLNSCSLDKDGALELQSCRLWASLGPNAWPSQGRPSTSIECTS